jgi:polyphenol oxidase
VHGARAVEASDSGQEADAIVAREGGLAVGVRTADCVPVLVADEVTRAVAAIHAGWRGIVSGVVGAGIDRLGGRRPVAAIGPCIGPCCFEVGIDVAERIERASGEASVVVRRAGERAYVDLRRAVRAQLVGSGVPLDRIDDVPGCTKHEPRFYSFRRDGAGGGRMLSAIATTLQACP